MSEAQIDISSLLDSNLDDLADLPEFATYHPGAHKVTIAWTPKKIGEHPALEAKFTLIETLELADTTLVPQAPGTESSVAFMLDNEFGQGNLKKVLTPLGQALGVGQVNQIIEKSQGMEITIVTKLRADKNDPDKKYLEIKSVMV